MKSHRKQRVMHKNASLAGMCNLNAEEILLHAALLRFWEGMGNWDNPYISLDGREIISLPDSQSSFDMSLDGKKYVHFSALEHASKTLIASIPSDKLKQRTKKNLHALFQFYKDAAFSMISCEPTWNPVYSAKVNGLQAHICDSDELLSFLRNKERGQEFFKPGNVIYLRVLLDAQKSLFNDISNIDSNQLPDNIRSDLNDLKKLNNVKDFDLHQNWSDISFFNDELYYFLCDVFFMIKSISPVIMALAIQYLTHFMLSHLNPYKQYIDPTDIGYLPHAVPFLLSAAATGLIFSKVEHLQVALAYFISLFFCVNDKLVNAVWQMYYLNMLIGMIQLHGLRPSQHLAERRPTAPMLDDVRLRVHTPNEPFAPFPALTNAENIRLLHAIQNRLVLHIHQVEDQSDDDTDSEFSFGFSDSDGRVSPGI